MPQVGDVDELKDASFMALSSPPSTNEAKSFVDAIVLRIKSKETRKRARSAEGEKQFTTTVGLILGDLLLAYDQGNRVLDEKSNNGLSYHSTSSNSFSESNVGYIMFKDTVYPLEELGFITIYEGRNARPIDFGEGTKQSFHGGFATRFKPLQPLIDAALKCGLVEGEFHKSFYTLMPKSVVEVRASKADGAQRGKKIPLPSNPKTEQIIEEVTAINAFLSSFAYDGMVFGGLRRLFNEGDRDDFDYNLGGRLYCANAQGHINMKSDARANILIDGEAVVEIDINASYLTILHALKNVPMPNREDIYAIAGLPREVVKRWFTITMGSTKFQTKWLRSNLDEMKEAGVAHKPWMTVKAVEKAVLEHFPIMKDWPKQEVRWSNLMFIESEVIIGTMLELMQTYQVPSLPVHDCIIVRKSDQDLAMRVLSEQFKEKVGIEPRLKVK